jgi:hypothetical protein
MGKRVPIVNEGQLSDLLKDAVVISRRRWALSRPGGAVTIVRAKDEAGEHVLGVLHGAKEAKEISAEIGEIERRDASLPPEVVT